MLPINTKILFFPKRLYLFEATILIIINIQSYHVVYTFL